VKRREFVTLVIAGVAGWSLASRAQQSALPVIGYLSARSAQSDAPMVAEFQKGLKQIGFVQGQNVAIEYRWAEDRYDRVPLLAADLANRQASVIAATGGTAYAAKVATATIPIVFTLASNPIEAGLVVSFSRPGGNVTGATFLGSEVEPKRLELLHQLVPDATIIGALVNPSYSTVGDFSTRIRNLQAPAPTLGVQIQVLNASTEHEIDKAFATLVERRAGALIVVVDPFLDSRREQIAVLAARYKVPTIHQFREIAVAGGLVSYNGNIAEAYRQAGIYTGRILKGDKPADLPIVQSTKFELVINLKTAKALGITIPPSIMVRADEVIE
jgi:putative ABC transport system substrate-binding protein